MKVHILLQNPCSGLPLHISGRISCPTFLQEEYQGVSFLFSFFFRIFVCCYFYMWPLTKVFAQILDCFMLFTYTWSSYFLLILFLSAFLAFLPTSHT